MPKSGRETTTPRLITPTRRRRRPIRLVSRLRENKHKLSKFMGEVVCRQIWRVICDLFFFPEHCALPERKDSPNNFDAENNKTQLRSPPPLFDKHPKCPIVHGMPVQTLAESVAFRFPPPPLQRQQKFGQLCRFSPRTRRRKKKTTKSSSQTLKDISLRRRRSRLNNSRAHKFREIFTFFRFY